jgi:hypothetical protein
MHTARDYRQLQRYHFSTHFQFTVTHALWFSAFTICILATDLSQSHWHFKSQMKSSFHNLIPFLPLLCNCQFHRLGSIEFFISWQAGVPKLDSSLLTIGLYSVASYVAFITHRHGPHRKQPLLLRRSVYWCYLAMDVLLLHAYSSLECVYLVVTYQWVYTSQYIKVWKCTPSMFFV